AALACIFTGTSLAAPGSISGKVTDKSRQPLVSVNIVLFAPDSTTLIKTALTDDKGIFELTEIKAGAYILKTNYHGFETYVSDKISVADAPVTLADIVLSEKHSTLKEVKITAQKPFIEVQSDKIVVNVEDSIVNAGSSAMEILQRSPGVVVDQSDNISLK